jgi:hypothetical protein
MLWTRQSSLASPIETICSRAYDRTAVVFWLWIEKGIWIVGFFVFGFA